MAEASPNGDARAVVLVEGVSDRAALAVLAERRGMDLAGAGIEIVSMDGITNIGHYLDVYCAPARETHVTGLYDDGEERFVRRGLGRVGRLEPGGDLEPLGFYACSPDLEDELIRALGPGAVEEIVEACGELRSFRTLQRQPAQRARSLHDQLRRLMGGRSGGKERYAAAMAAAVPLDQVPRPLDAVLAHVCAAL
ncbi:ATP-dependent endonuclease [Actinospica sp. MGRD01-02]|uniref:ATP-dependent endonuclease n=1 Tax=Actinospica acidithermotolerans TaxID=2828514 RepID=A0A941IH86_9ACTN|nr:TOPRIM nucleotidyl transferase/hydrolase domain-containing protein [Actinospica acidithermotolerans]MBR7825447.1 ATP-dependent endonuclease [Actinospica acidithermotolerans]